MPSLVLGIMPGSMASPGFVVSGKGNPESLNSASHGAGRVMSRTQATKTFEWKTKRLSVIDATWHCDLAGRLAAKKITLDQTAISRVENQTRYVMDYEAAAIAKVLKVSMGWLFGEG